MLLTSVSTLPTACAGAWLEVSADSCGESPATVMPHSASQAANRASCACSSHGASRQQAPLIDNCQAATRALPTRRAQPPPPTQPTAPSAITANAAHDSADWLARKPPLA